MLQGREPAALLPRPPRRRPLRPRQQARAPALASPSSRDPAAESQRVHTGCVRRARAASKLRTGAPRTCASPIPRPRAQHTAADQACSTLKAASAESLVACLFSLSAPQQRCDGALTRGAVRGGRRARFCGQHRTAPFDHYLKKSRAVRNADLLAQDEE
eukprot:1980370-Rhodomonas_salina.3